MRPFSDSGRFTRVPNAWGRCLSAARWNFAGMTDVEVLRVKAKTGESALQSSGSEKRSFAAWRRQHAQDRARLLVLVSMHAIRLRDVEWLIRRSARWWCYLYIRAKRCRISRARRRASAQHLCANCVGVRDRGSVDTFQSLQARLRSSARIRPGRSVFSLPKLECSRLRHCARNGIRIRVAVNGRPARTSTARPAYKPLAIRD